MRGLRRYLATEPAPVLERCELCATDIPAEHPHLVHVADRRLVCACGPCAFLFDAPGAGGYARVPDRVRRADGLDDATWEALQIPVGAAFVLRNSVQDRLIACYPSPAGATESELPVPAGLPLLAELAPDVEALLVRRDPPESYLVPVDECYRLVGLVRRHWTGFDGGPAAHAAIDGFFAELEARAC
ncbi:DUF5947 family protein [Pseudonocardia xishanensis]|uniref:DUF5947 family protein n=1 Tax=Pseudonocardia xishanensis TaxID=630995 RepID=A0ABP8S1N2_9PSEU